ncbi:MAG: ThiF family adenylyltransferase, partial [Acidimicrobiia bacterium]
MSIEVLPADVDLSRFAMILDVRPPTIRARSIPGSTNVPLDLLLAEPDTHVPDRNGSVLVVCDMGIRSRLVAQQLREAGYPNVTSLAGGIEAWAMVGLALEGDPSLGPDDLARYDRHIKLPEIGVDGQVRVRASRISIIGAGGLGAPAIEYLAGAGVGRLRIVDPDVIEISNLHRQPIYRSHDVGSDKVIAAAGFVAGLNDTVVVEPMREALTPDTADRMLKGSDVVIDATDRFEATYAISDSAQRLGIPVVTAAVYRWEGQLSVLVPGGPCYRCIFPTPPDGA